MRTGTAGVARSMSGPCARATAQGLTVDRVAGVLCGAFLGPGSQAMVVSLTTGNCLPYVGWELYVLKAGAWQHVPLPPHGGLSGHAPRAAGNDIQETLDVRRPGDTLCKPTGGTKTRVWHWNGTRLVAGPWRQATAPTPSTTPTSGFKYGFFKTPSGNIQCEYQYGGNAPGGVQCGIKSGLKPPPPRRGPGCSQSNRVSLAVTGRVQTGKSICPGEDEGDAGPFAGGPTAFVLGYGKTWSGGGLSCTSAVSGLTCRNKDGHGFFLSRGNWRQF